MWFYGKNGEQHGPIEADDIRNRLRSGELSNETLVWREGMSQWSPLGEILELREPVPPGGVAPEQVPSMAPAAEVTPVPASFPAPNPISSPSPTSSSLAHSRSAPRAPQLVAPVQQNSMALISMILGVVSVLCGWIFTGIPAIIFGHLAKKKIRESPVSQTGEGLATAGLIMGYLMTILSVIIAIAIVAFNMLGSPASGTIPVFGPTP